MRSSKMLFLVSAALGIAFPTAPHAKQQRFTNGATISISFVKAGIGGSAKIVRRKSGEPTRAITIEYVSGEPVIINDNTFRYFSIGIMDMEAAEMDQHCDYQIVVDWKRGRIAKSTLLPTSFHLCPE